MWCHAMTPDPAEIAASQKWRHISTAPKDAWIFVYAAPYTGGGDDPEMWLPGFVSLCHWHPDGGFCVDELRQPIAWQPIVYPDPPLP